MASYTLKRAAFFTLVFLLMPQVHADCQEPIQGQYPGITERFFGNLSFSDSVAVDDLNISITRALGDAAIEVNVLKHSAYYVKTSVSAGQSGMLKKSDFWIELYNTTSSSAYISVYTPHRANTTANLTRIKLLSGAERTTLMPNEDFQVDFSLNNTGELEAKDVKITPQFGDFGILSADVSELKSMCPFSDRIIKYVLKTPALRKEFNYTLYLWVEYSDENIQTNQVNSYEEFYPFQVRVIPSVVTIERSTSNWTLTNPGRDVAVKVTLKNEGNNTASNVRWSDVLPPDAVVIQGTTSWNGSIPERGVYEFTYKLISDDPLMCLGTSEATYEDLLGNKYTAFSNNATISFSPFISVDKNIGGFSWYIDPTKNVMGAATTWSIDEADWWNNRTRTVVTNSPTKVWINRTANVTVKIKNRGNAVARDLLVNETLTGLNVTGTTQWKGDLMPDEEVSYNYTVETLVHGNVTIQTNVTYPDVDMSSFWVSEVGGEPVTRYCTKKLDNVSYQSVDNFYGLHSNANITISYPAKVLSGFEFYFNTTVTANESDSIYDVITRINVSSLNSSLFGYGGPIIKGQPTYYEPVLRGQYYPDGAPRPEHPTNVTYDFIMMAPEISNDTNFTITAAVSYKEFSGKLHEAGTVVNVTVVPVRHAYAIITTEKKNISVSIDHANETNIDDYGEAFIIIKGTGYAALNVTVNVSVPSGLEIYSNDTAWNGRIEAQLKRGNDTWYGMTGSITWNGTIGVREQKKIPLLVRGKKAGIYTVSYKISYDRSEISGSFDLKVRGAILMVGRWLSGYEAGENEYIDVAVIARNVGEDAARNVMIADYVPANFDVDGATEMSVPEIKPGDEAALRYKLKSSQAGSYSLGAAAVEWTDALGNEYSKGSPTANLKIAKQEVPPPPAEELKISKKQAIVLAVIILVIFAAMLRLLFFSKPVSKE